jgi:hypothetical protein
MNDQVSKKLHAFENDHVWVCNHLKSLLNQYEDQWVAVQNEQVIASDPDFHALLRKLPDPGNTCVEFVTREPLEMII